MTTTLRSPVLLGVILAAGCSNGHSSPPSMAKSETPAAALPPAAPALAVRGIDLPGATADGVYMDYLAYDRAGHRVWVPAGNTGSVDVIDTRSDTLTRIDGFPTAEMERRGKKRTVGPSSATVGDGVVYVGNRADSKVCAIDAATLKLAGCTQLASMPDGLQYVARTREVWVTTPRDNTVTILDVSDPRTPKAKTVLHLEGQPEGFAVDEPRGVFYTNFEDKDRTLTLDLASKQVTRTWEPHCGEDGPKGIAVDHASNQVLVACADHVVVLDAEHGGAELARIDTGDGVDDIGYVEARHEVFVGAARAGKLTVARLDPAAHTLTAVAVVPTADGARNAVATEDGVAYLTDAREGKILVVEPVR